MRYGRLNDRGFMMEACPVYIGADGTFHERTEDEAKAEGFKRIVDAKPHADGYYFRFDGWNEQPDEIRAKYKAVPLDEATPAERLAALHEADIDEMTNREKTALLKDIVKEVK